ncbi:MAG: amidohydrolase family protein [Planctomycetota bacterium]
MLCALTLAACAHVSVTPEPASELVLHVGKILTVDAENRVVNRGYLHVRDGKIVAIATTDAGFDVGPGAERIERPDLWAFPGMVDLHCHISTNGFSADLNDMNFPLNPDLRSQPGIRVGHAAMRRACASGVTTAFVIPGSGTSISGFGTVLKFKTDPEGRYADTVVRDPGGVKVAQNFNPERRAGDLGLTQAGLAWNLESLNDRVARQVASGSGTGDPLLANLEAVHRGELPVLIHCASAEGVANTVRMWKLRYGTQCVISHGSWDGHYAAAFAAEHGVPVNHGPRVINHTSMRREGKIQGGAAAYVAAGVPLFSLNTDSPIVPQEELFVQGTVSARYGADAETMLRALTTHPAQSFQLGDRVGSLAVGLDADIVLFTGDPLDPRSAVELVLIDGEVQYDRSQGQWF